KAQLDLAQYTAEVMQRQLVKARAKFIKDHPGLKTAEADTFCRGWTYGVTKTIIAFAHPEGTEQAIDLYLADKTAGRLAKTQSRQGSWLASQLGADAAKNVSIHRPMNGKTDHLKLG